MQCIGALLFLEEENLEGERQVGVHFIEAEDNHLPETEAIGTLLEGMGELLEDSGEHLEEEE